MAATPGRFGRFFCAMPNILVPEARYLNCRWPTVACDQYTMESDEQYWEHVRKVVGNEPSTLRLMLPERYLKSSDLEERLSAIHRSMDSYLAQGVFAPSFQGLVYVERTTARSRLPRRGVMICLDLEQYEYDRTLPRSPVRPTEETVAERIPLRVRIRAGAKIEMPHVLVLLDDDEQRVIEPLAHFKGEPVYDIELMPVRGLHGILPHDARPRSALVGPWCCRTTMEARLVTYVAGRSHKRAWHPLNVASTIYATWSVSAGGTTLGLPNASYCSQLGMATTVLLLPRPYGRS